MALLAFTCTMCLLIVRLLSTQVVELQNRLSEESKKADKMEFEYKRVKEKVDSLQKEKDVRRADLCVR